MLNRTRAFVLGIHDGFDQPYDLSSSHNVDHLFNGSVDVDVDEWMNRGINIGQFVRAGRKSQSFTEFFWPFRKRR